jgi:hypothetical protein
MRPALALALLLAGCGGGPEGENARVDANQIARLSTPEHEPVVDPQLLARPQPLGIADLEAEGMPNPTCDFTADGRRLLAATAADAIAKINGRIYHFNHSSPAGPTGGFFEDRQLSISVGRTGAIDPVDAQTGRWAGRISVSNRRADARVELSGVWRCGA